MARKTTVCDVTNNPLFARCWKLHSQMHDSFKCTIRYSPVAILMQSCTCAHDVLTCPCLCGGEYRFCLGFEYFHFTKIIQILMLKQVQ